MSGIYNYHPVVNSPMNNYTVQTATQQPPFYFGASQVPINLFENKPSKTDISVKGTGLRSALSKKMQTKNEPLQRSAIYNKRI